MYIELPFLDICIAGNTFWNVMDIQDGWANKLIAQFWNWFKFYWRKKKVLTQWWLGCAWYEKSNKPFVQS